MKNWEKIRGCIFIFIILISVSKVLGQASDTTKEITLSSIVIKAFEQNKKLKDVPAAVSYIGKATLGDFSPTSIVSAMNTAPGVRMEERSPGSYRLNIRGSSLRSPFGVRNVKIYYNDIPYTDPGGNTYLNQLGYYNINSIEVIKGANNSVYGAGTGGALLIQSLNPLEKSNVSAEYSSGSYNMQSVYGSLTIAEERLVNKFGVQHQTSDGYRDHSNLKRDDYSWDGVFKFDEKHSLKTSFLFGDLFYQTPGALTKSEYLTNPRAARPKVGFIPGAVSANTSIHQQLFLAGATYTQPVVKNVNNKTTLYGYFAELRNPSIASYGKSSEPNFGGRTVFNFDKKFNEAVVQAELGLEYQKGFTTVSTSKNVGGSADSLRMNDEINLQQHSFFGQVSIDYKSWTTTLGASLNKSRIAFQRFAPASKGLLKRNFDNQVAPRLAIMKKLGSVNVYTAISKGFSPPTTAELVPTGGGINLGLNAENAINYELGIKATVFKKLFIDVNAFTLSLENTIVQKRDASGSDSYYNAGSTQQHGIEAYINYDFNTGVGAFLRNNFSLSYTLYDFHYKNFKQQLNDYSGNQLPSVAPNTLHAGYDVALKCGFFGSFNYLFTDKIALNDANSEFASSYQLVSLKAGVEKRISGMRLRLAAGADNLLNEHDSLGNDINGFAGRYYNASPERNYYISLGIQFACKKSP
ncbi:MAG: TonB-dependent receptor [Ginsengibacter sp.]